MNTKQIECVLDLSKTLNFNHTAENLYMSQSTVSYTIKSIEDEIGFRLFDRNGKGAVLTPAGAQFCATLRSIQKMYDDAVNQGQNFARQYKDDITISIPFRTAIYFLPKAIEKFSKLHPDTSITVHINENDRVEKFLRHEDDILFSSITNIKRIPSINTFHLFNSYFYLVTRSDDPLSKKTIINAEDLKGRTLMVGGPSPKELLDIQNDIISKYNVDYFNSISHDFTLVNIAAKKGICISPGLLNDHSNEFKWIKYNSDSHLAYVLCTHDDASPKTKDFINIIINLYKENPNFMI